jgi:protein gp37
MAEHSSIEWTDATWNPITGCSVVSPGCTNCYAMKLAGGRLQHHPTRKGLTTPSKAGPVWTGDVRLNEAHMLDPLRWTRARRIFVCAHGDLFHESVPDEWIDRAFVVMALTERHTFQVLTKRADRMRAYLSTPWRGAHIWKLATTNPIFSTVGMQYRGDIWPLPNVWLGVSAEDQARLDERVPDLIATPAALRFVSLEPLLGPIDLTTVQAPRYVPADHDLDWKFNALETGDYYQFQDGLGFWEGGDGPDRLHRLDWVIVGGESGPRARPMHPDWARGIRDACAAAGVPFHFKQWGAWREFGHDDGPEVEQVDVGSEEAAAIAAISINGAWLTADGRFYRNPLDLPENVPGRLMEAVGKKAAGRVLDGRLHDAMPAHVTEILGIPQISGRA